MSKTLVIMPFKIDCSKWHLTGDTNLSRQILHGLNKKVDVVGNFGSFKFMSDSEVKDFLNYYNIDKAIDVSQFSLSKSYAKKTFEYLSENDLLSGYSLINVHNSNPALIVRINQYLLNLNCNVVFTLHSPPENSTFQFYHREDYLEFLTNDKCLLMCVSKSHAERCLKALNYYKDYPDKEPNIAYILNGIPVNKYDNELVYDCGTIGRFSPTKNVLESLLCVATITKHTGGKGFYVGTGSNYEESSDKQKEYVDAIMKVLQDNPQIEWYEELPNEDIKSMLSKTRCYIALSTIETFGLTVCEALMQGTPSIGFDINGIGEIIEDGITGYKFAKKRSSWNKRYEEVLDLYDKCINLNRSEVYSRSVERFNIDRVLKDYNELYERLGA